MYFSVAFHIQFPILYPGSRRSNQNLSKRGIYSLFSRRNDKLIDIEYFSFPNDAKLKYPSFHIKFTLHLFMGVTINVTSHCTLKACKEHKY